MENATLKLGFKVLSVTLYPEYAQVNGAFVSDVDMVPSPMKNVTINVGVADGSVLVPGIVYDFTLTPQTQPEPDTTPERAVAVDTRSSDGR